MNDVSSDQLATCDSQTLLAEQRSLSLQNLTRASPVLNVSVFLHFYPIRTHCTRIIVVASLSNFSSLIYSHDYLRSARGPFVEHLRGWCRDADKNPVIDPSRTPRIRRLIDGTYLLDVTCGVLVH